MNTDYYCDEVLSGKTPVDVVKETSTVLAFIHTRPAWEMHIAVIPKTHVARLADVKDMNLAKDIFEVLQSIILEKGLHEKNYKIVTNGGSYQSTPHLHFHLVSGLPLDPNNPHQVGELRV